jgi:hypothetical protein
MPPTMTQHLETTSRHDFRAKDCAVTAVPGYVINLVAKAFIYGK